jgi:hypothetical protein
VVLSANRRSASAATSLCPLRTAASTSSTAAQPGTTNSTEQALARWAACIAFS